MGLQGVSAAEQEKVREFENLELREAGNNTPPVTSYEMYDDERISS